MTYLTRRLLLLSSVYSGYFGKTKLICHFRYPINVTCKIQSITASSKLLQLQKLLHKMNGWIAAVWWNNEIFTLSVGLYTFFNPYLFLMRYHTTGIPSINLSESRNGNEFAKLHHGLIFKYILSFTSIVKIS